MTLKEIVEAAEVEAIYSALTQNASSRRWITDAAEQLGITRKNLWEKMLKYDIDKIEFEQLPPQAGGAT